MREKDQRLADGCQKLSEACSESIRWVSDNPKTVGAQQENLNRQLKLAAVDARKLARAATRPTSLAIFGPSQVGKSFLTGTLLGDDMSAGEEGACSKIVFGAGDKRRELTFLTEVNPIGGAETTGLVTRFTVAEDIETPPDFPVALRMLTEIDIVKILVNSFIFDLSADAARPLKADMISGVIEKLESRVEVEPVDTLRQEDIFELELYRPHPFAKMHPLYGDDLSDLYWQNTARLAPYLKIEDRIELYAPLWGETPEFTGLFRELKKTLDRIGHPEWAFVRLDAIADRLPGETVLHVLTMKKGLADKGADQSLASQLAEIATPDGQTFSVRKPVITALACELRAQLASKPWDFFENTDLLDFPGARGRKGQTRDQFFNDPSEEYPIGEAFLRGKVAVMFDNYAADLDLNTLIACHKAEQSTTVSFPELIRQWVHRTHGATPEARVGKPVNLFMLVTWCDQLFDESAGQDRLDVSLNNKLSFLGKFSDFIPHWTPDAPFTNTFLLRNPQGKKLEDLYIIDPPGAPVGTPYKETAVRPDKQERLNYYKEQFLLTDMAKGHFDKPAEKFQAILEPNDGGVTYLADALRPACTADVKYRQVAPKAQTLKHGIGDAMRVFHEGDGADERVKKRAAAISEVIEILKSDLSTVPDFVSRFQVDEEKMRALYANYQQRNLMGVRSPGEDPQSFGEVVVRAWAHSSDRACQDMETAAYFQLQPDQMKRVAGELEAAFRMMKVADRIQEKIDHIVQYSPGSPRHAEQVAAHIAKVINEFVNYLGCRGALLIEELPAAPVFTPALSVDGDGLPVLAPLTRDMQSTRDKFMTDWLAALLHLTCVNARSTEGGLIDIEQNAQLGAILEKIDAVAIDD